MLRSPLSLWFLGMYSLPTEVRGCCSVHAEEFSSFQISHIELFLCPADYSSSIPYGYHSSSINHINHHCSTLTLVLPWLVYNIPFEHFFFFIFSGQKSSHSRILRHLYPSSSVYFITVPSPNSTSSLWTCFHLFVFDNAHFSNPNCIPMSSDTIFTTLTRLSISLPLLP